MLQKGEQTRRKKETHLSANSKIAQLDLSSCVY